jgi:uncharacterized surface protein with fasciclin (FAS1) repeats
MTIIGGLRAGLLAIIGASAVVTSAAAQNAVEVADRAGTFKTLLTAAKAAGLAEALATTEPITIFAPTDAAFAKLPKGTVAKLLKPENRDQLRAILTYHVLPSRVLARQVPHKPTFVKTLNPADTVRVVRSGSRVHVDKARVVKADIRADNGVIHVIDRVLIPHTKG